MGSKSGAQKNAESLIGLACDLNEIPFYFCMVGILEVASFLPGKGKHNDNTHLTANEIIILTTPHVRTSCFAIASGNVGKTKVKGTCLVFYDEDTRKVHESPSTRMEGRGGNRPARLYP